MNKIAVFIAAVILIVIVGVLGWQFKGSLKSLLSPAPATQTPTEATTTTPVATVNTYASSTLGFSLQYAPGYTLNESYAYDQFGPKKLIHGVSLTIPATMATGTNLASDTRLSVEQLPHAKSCTGDIFLPSNVKATSVTINTINYSVASSSGAGAGNRYEEIVYAFKDSKPCTAVRYFIHYGAIENYPAGAVKEFDRSALLSDFDKIRNSITFTH